MAGEGQQFKAGADINTSVFVTVSADDTIVTAGAGDTAIGVMHESTWATPIPGYDVDVAVIAGQSKRVYQSGEVCEVRVGVADLNAGDKVMADANGAAIAAVGKFDGIVTAGGVAGGRAKIKVEHGVA